MAGDARQATLSEIADQQLDEQLAKEAQQAHVAREMRPLFGAASGLVDPNLCFVLMPFDPALREIYDDFIVAAAAECELVAARADDLFSNRPIMQDIWEHINRARVIVADLTGKNPNVFYEVGIAHTVGRDVILCAQSIEDVPFDLRPLRVIIYATTPRAMIEFKESLKATIRSILSPPEAVQGTVLK